MKIFLKECRFLMFVLRIPSEVYIYIAKCFMGNHICIECMWLMCIMYTMYVCNAYTHHTYIYICIQLTGQFTGSTV